MDKKRIFVKQADKNLVIGVTHEKNLMELLKQNQIHISGICNGNGTCGKCKIKVLSGNVPVTEADKKILSEEELKQGIRLACRVNMEKICEKNAEKEVTVEIIDSSEEEIVVEGLKKMDERESRSFESNVRETEQDKKYFIAVDIGTTTIAMALVECGTGNVREIYSGLNHQRKFGADVISRITAANGGKQKELKQLVEEDLWKGIQEITKEIPKENKITKIVLAGNTTMIHLLMGYSCETLGKYPFQSDYLKQYNGTLQECISISQNSEFGNLPVTILSGISAFVGADIVAGIMACEGFETEEISLLIDLGTNAEMVLGNKEKIVVTSAAAGPAFEGGNITQGTASIPRAISQVKIQNQRAIIRTIGGKMPPIGICGTGVISAIAGLKENKLMDVTGNLRYPYHEKGFPLWKNDTGGAVLLFQKDIREIQLAKAALRSGIEILMEEYGCSAEEIKKIYLAGGFGTRLSEEEAIAVGILPEEFRGKVESIGNGVLKGLITFAIDKENDKQILSDEVTVISLAQKKEFQKKYIEYVNFVV